MEGSLGTGDVIIGVAAAIGVVIMIVVFFLVVKMVFFKPDGDKE